MTSGSSARYGDARKRLLSGKVDDWDITSLIWVLLFCSHTKDGAGNPAGLLSPGAARGAAGTAGAGAGAPSGVDAGTGVAGEASLALLGRPEFASLAEEVRSGLQTVRRLRNHVQHISSWELSAAKFATNMKALGAAIASVQRLSAYVQAAAHAVDVSVPGCDATIAAARKAFAKV